MNRWIPAAIVLFTIVVGCGDGDSAAPDDVDGGGVVDGGVDGGADECTVLALGRRDFQFDLFGTVTGLRYPVAPGIDGAAPEMLLIELYDSTTPELPPLTTGTFELGVAPDDDLATCQHCVWLPVDSEGQPPFEAVFVATSGTLTLTRITDPLYEDSIFAGSTSEIVLREATMDETGHTTLLPAGRCLRAPAIAFDTAPTPGSSCVSAEDCGNPLLEVCSPATGKCAAPECDDFFWCTEERPICLSQYRDMFQGACYAACDPTLGGSGGCGDGSACVQYSVDPAFGYCKHIGDGAIGADCEREDTSTSCLLGAICSPDTLTCTRTCAAFAGDSGCQDGSLCTILGVCEPPDSGVDVGFGELCGDDAELAQGCAPDGEAFRGICFSFLWEEPLVCSEACFGDLGCEPEEFCALRFTSGLGICLPDPVCGDGELGEIDEVCDDGNTESGDGCSGDCQTVEYDVICSAPPALAADSTTSGDTSSAWDGFFATCQGGTSRAELFSFTPPSRGRLRLSLESPTAQVVSLRTDCADAGSERECADSFGFEPDLIYQVTDPSEPLTVLVSAYTVLDQGPYLLHTEFIAESCGDGVVAGLEVCDDGNTSSGDGCAGDCLAVEYDVYCAAATDLSIATPTAGDNAAGPRIYDASCSNDWYGSGPDRLYRVTAPASGTLRLSLDEGSVNLTLAVFDGCGEPGAMAELGCSSVYGVEHVEVAVSAGQTLTVLVEGFSPDDAGPYTLTAEML